MRHGQAQMIQDVRRAELTYLEPLRRASEKLPRLLKGEKTLSRETSKTGSPSGGLKLCNGGYSPALRMKLLDFCGSLAPKLRLPRPRRKIVKAGRIIEVC